MHIDQAAGVVTSLVPIRFQEDGKWASIVPKLLRALDQMRDELEEAERQLYAMAKGDKKLEYDIRKYIEGCKVSITGTYDYR